MSSVYYMSNIHAVDLYVKDKESNEFKLLASSVKKELGISDNEDGDGSVQGK